ncbi:LIV-I protein H [Hartmannibacter diazotrophicus]|uniref:LIV-I protein H n=1 Tax=Hartmannibacter diazotrophicus TaxID=1482074 RepID=A0A2C9DCE5_9HYPH|nr:branched-chain amino acid ABC transporter permease [Hartmannibacter diazotrophicus]SON57849.1 LIV-I protein H [Hartmannibacter diazotrophicus]
MGLGPYLLLATLEGLVQSAVLALAAIGLSLVFGVMRIVNVAHGEFFMLGAMVAAVVAGMVPGPPVAGFLAAIVCGPLVAGLLAYGAERIVLRPIAQDPQATIVATIGLLYVVQQGALMGFGPDTLTVVPPFHYTLRLPWFGYSSYKLFVIGAALVLLAAVWLIMRHTRLGLVMRATQLDPEIATAFGISVGKVQGLVFAFGAGLAALAAVLVVPIRQAHYLMGGDILLMSFAVVIIGGLGSLGGTLVAALIIGLSDGILSVFFSPTLAKIISTLAVALVLVLRPHGLFGKAAP